MKANRISVAVVWWKCRR